MQVRSDEEVARNLRLLVKQIEDAGLASESQSEPELSEGISDTDESDSNTDNVGRGSRIADNDAAAHETSGQDHDVDRRLLAYARSLLDRNADEASHKRAYKGTTKDRMLHLCRKLSLGSSLFENKDKASLSASLIEEVRSEGSRYEQPNSPATFQVTSNIEVYENLLDYVKDVEEEIAIATAQVTLKNAVLSVDVMQAIWGDMTRTCLPSWITPAPRNWGTAKRQKLSAGNWRVIATVHVPVSLIWLWKDEDGRKLDLLEHFMDLVTAVRIANAGCPQDGQVDEFEACIFRYVKNITRLYPSERLKPVHHVSLHMPQQLRDTGPAPSYSSAHYECYIGHFHQINTNKIIGGCNALVPITDANINLVPDPGQMEGTFMKESLRSATLQARLAENSDAQALVPHMLAKVDSVAAEGDGIFKFASFLDPMTTITTAEGSPWDLGETLWQRFCNDTSTPEIPNPRQECTLTTHIIYLRGVRYASSTSRASQDSNVVFQSGSGDVTPAIIQRFICYQEPGNEPKHYVLADRLERLPPGEDPYWRFGFASGFLCSENVDTPQYQYFPLTHLVPHSAVTPFQNDGKRLVHILPLDRVRYDQAETVYLA